MMGVILGALFLGGLRLDLELGQMNVYCAILIMGGFFALRNPRGILRDLGVGLLLALAIQLKLFVLILFPFLFFRGEWRLLIFSVFAIAVTSIGGLAIQRGWEAALIENGEWLRSLFASTKELIPHETNVSLVGWGTRIGGETFARILWFPFFLAFVGYSYAIRKKDTVHAASVLILGILFLNPLVWSYWNLFLIPLVILHFQNKRDWCPEDFLWVAVALSFQGQHSHFNMRYGYFPALVLLVYLTRRTLYEVFKSADCLEPSRSR